MKQGQDQVVLKNFMWRFLERCGSQGVAFLVSVILARKLLPEVYGTVAIVTVFTNILQVFVDSGFGVALIQKKDADQLDFSTVFFFNIGFSFLLYAGMFFAAPWLAAFYDKPELVPIVRVLSLIVLIAGVRNVQQSYVSRNMQFKKFFYATLGGTIISGIVSIILVYLDFGVWALVIHTLANAAVSVAILWYTVKWHPSMQFSFQRLKTLFSFGWKLLMSSLIDTLYNNIRSLIIGKLYSSEQLAHYDRGKQLPHLIVININSSIDSVLLPTMSAKQDDTAAVRSMTRRAIKISSYIMMPLMMGLAVCAEPIVRLVLTDNWLPCVPFLRIFCFTYAFYPIHTANLNAIKAMGRSDLFLYLEIAKKVVGLAAVAATFWISVEAMAYSLLATSIFSQIINAWPNKKLLGYSYLDQIKDMLPQLILSCFMGAVVFTVGLLGLPSWLTLLIQIPVGAAIYILGSALFRMDSYTYILNTAKHYIRPKAR
ncbi:MAG: lipopolysaccharide biosynthesis protein [Oscillospiraceae bacterium]|nr:lipopolysaccharide biosynthesis protein [Oscillospiraceae bacterium]